mmetsp:Transcript_13853/g.23036  ORF Transcript_13853/g.23036 Transcript_13853/m.23036 type:complete len:80 (-) Transcript_13853:533-772(-)
MMCLMPRRLPLSLSLNAQLPDDSGTLGALPHTYCYELGCFSSQAQRNIKGSSFSAEASSPMMTASSSSSPPSSILDFLD